MTLSKYALMQQASIGPFDTLSMYYILLIPCYHHNFSLLDSPRRRVLGTLVVTRDHA